MACFYFYVRNMRLSHPSTVSRSCKAWMKFLWRFQRRFCPRWMCHSGNLEVHSCRWLGNPHEWCQRDECDSAPTVSRYCLLLHAFSQLRRARWPNRSARLLYRATRAHEPDLLTRQTKAEFVLRNSTEILRGGGSIRNFWVTGGRGATCSPLNQRCETKAVPR